MLRFIIRRTLFGVVVMLLVTIMVFGIFFIGGSQHDVAARLAGRNANEQTIQLITRRLHLDKPLYVQYWDFLDRLVWHHDLGESYYHGQSVATVIGQAFWFTFWLAAGAAVIWLVLGILSGVLSAVKRGSLLDRLFTTIALFFYSMPTFVLGTMLLYLVSYQLQVRKIRWFPGQFPVNLPHHVGAFFQDYTLPWITLALVTAATYTRLTRGSLLEVMGEDYIRTARAKGLPERRVIFRHGLRSALTPVASQFGIDVGTLIGGAVVTETVFGIPGLGRTAVLAIGNSDLPVIIGIVIIASAAVVVANILVDILYAVLDPRVRLH